MLNIPVVAKKARNFFFIFLTSEKAPKIGANNIIKRPESEFAVPIAAVLSIGERSAAQKDLKNIGKNPAITVVAKTELAQSYKAHETIFFLFRMSII